MDKDLILAEIKRTAEQNGGVPLGREKFARVTGIKTTDRYGRHWSRWGDALAEAGYAPNEFQSAYDERDLLKRLALLVQELGHFPVLGELRIKARQATAFPSHSAFAKLGSKDERVRKVLEYCGETPGFEDVISICQPLVIDGKKKTPQGPKADTEAQFGYVYLARMGRYYKIGHTGSLGRRHYEIALQLPEKLTLVHSISTDDPAGIEDLLAQALRASARQRRPKMCKHSSAERSCDAYSAASTTTPGVPGLKPIRRRRTYLHALATGRYHLRHRP